MKLLRHLSNLQVVIGAVGGGAGDLLDVDLDPLARASLEDPLAGAHSVTATPCQGTWRRRL